MECFGSTFKMGINELTERVNFLSSSMALYVIISELFEIYSIDVTHDNYIVLCASGQDTTYTNP